MTSGELSAESSLFLRVTWAVPDYYRLATEAGHSLQSPHFASADGRYCLRLFPSKCFDDDDDDGIEIELVNLSDTDPGRAVLCEVHFKSRVEEIMMRRCVRDNRVRFFFPGSYLERHKDKYVPGGTLTVLCSVRPRKPSSAATPKASGAETRVIPKRRMSGRELSSESLPSLYVTWTIPGFFQMATHPMKYINTLESPAFSFSDRCYRLKLFSYSHKVDIQLVNWTDTVPGRCVSYEAGLKSTSGEEIHMHVIYHNEKIFRIPQSELDRKKSECFPDGQLTVFCCMGSREPSIAGSSKSGGEVRTPGSKAAAHLRSVGIQTSNVEENQEGLPGVVKVLSDYKRLLLMGVESDACLVVGGKEFRAHRNVLRVRSPVFEAMFGHETAEKDSGRVVIDDLKPDRFQDFMEYLYTGRLEVFCDENAFGLYAAADKYDVPTLKSECVEYMRRSLSVDNFCDVVTVALRHHEKDLLELAIEFFKQNVADIILTVKWQQFMSENSTRANEFFIKLHVPGKESDNVLLL